MTYLPSEAKELFDAGYGTDEIVRRGITNAEGRPASSRTARRWKQEWKKHQSPIISYDEPAPEEDEVIYSESGAQTVLSSTSTRITSVDQLLRESKVDLELWEVERFVVNKWEGYRRAKTAKLHYDKGKATGEINDTGKLHVEPLFQIKVWLKRRVDAPVMLAIEDLIAELKRAAPRYEKVLPIKSSGRYMFLPSLFDVHFNRRGWTPEEAADTFLSTGKSLLDHALGMNMPIDLILFPVGNDVLNADNLAGSTTKGTWQDLAGDQRDAVREMCKAHFALIEYYASVAPVDVVVVGSNHDRFSTFWLGMVLEARFTDHPNVRVDTDRHPRKYYRYGSTLLGFDHGDEVKADRLGLIMAHEAPDQWAKSTYREWLRGHIHTRQQLYYQATEDVGVSIRVLPALCPSSEWETLKGLIGNHRAGEGLFYHQELGPAGAFPVFVKEL